MKTLTVLDTTLRDGEQSPGCSMQLKEKLEVAKQLEHLGVDFIEAGFPIASPDDFQAVKAIANTIKGAGIAGLCRATAGDISCAWEALKGAAAPRIHIFLATSDIHLRYKLGISREEVLDKAVSAVAFARRFLPDVEFSAEDATRTDRDFLMEVYNRVIQAGATLINVTDTVGYLLPQETESLIRYVKQNLINPAIPVGIHCHNDLGMATANTLAAVAAGADHIEGTINGIGERAGNAALEEVIMALKTRQDLLGCQTRINTRELYRSSRLVSTIIDKPVAHNKAVVGENAFVHEAGVHQHGMMNNPLTYEIMSPADIGLQTNSLVLGKHSGKAAFEQRMKELGYALDGEKLAAAFKSFKQLADHQKAITDRELCSLVEGAAQIRQTYSLKSFVVNSGTLISATAVVCLEKDSQCYEKVARGPSPILAAFNAVDKIVGEVYQLESFVIQSMAAGRDSLGEVVVQLGLKGQSFIGRGLANDIVGACIHAYISAVNKSLCIS
ncbi:2-isopropylmalate synthase [Oscillospiraceae bacterium MB08-C2-2]|nr:2-isopropylmalate synthase [Oscillospiraceae bacterium MB08-C2-2]